MLLFDSLPTLIKGKGRILNQDELIKQLTETNKELHKQLEDSRQDCFKCVCGIATACNCYHLGLRSKHLTNLSTYDKVESILKDLEF
tara:strand:- start:120 stop:380 length:261 start_codon:yes stop_codon:yes gene_type:complete